MKAKFLIIPALVGMFVVTSCNKKATEQTMTSINEFETNWKAVAEQAAQFNTELEATITKTNECVTKCETMAAAATADDAKAKCTELCGNCKKDGESFTALKAEYTAFQTQQEEGAKMFAEWNEKVKKGEINDEQAVAALKEYQTKLDEVKGKVDTWTKTFATAKETCMKNMDACAEYEKVAAESKDKKDDKKAAPKKKA